MAVSNAKLLALVALILASRAFPAARLSASQPIDVNAQSFYTDGTNNVVFRKVTITQGTMSISADQGQGQGSRQASGPDFNNSLWTFRGNVKITVQEGQLNADDAEIRFANQQLSKAVANGKQAQFEGHVEKTGKTAHGKADTIDYDASKGVVRLLSNAWLTYGETELRGESLKYIVGQSIVADQAEQNSQPVHITITPPPAKP